MNDNRLCIVPRTKRNDQPRVEKIAGPAFFIARDAALGYTPAMQLLREPSIWSNVTLWSAALGWIAAQTIKFARHFARTRASDFSYYVSTGGMPSAHSALVSSLAASVGISQGPGSALFAVTTIFALIVMFDAQGVRRAAGLQARMLNQIVEELVKQHHWPRRQKLAELLGHSRHEVFAGFLLGVAIAFGVHAIWHRL